MRRIPGSERQNPKLDPRNQHSLSGAGFNVMLRLDRSIHWVTMPFFAVDSAVEPQNDTLWKGFNAGFSAADCRLENCGSSFGQNPGNMRRIPRSERQNPGNMRRIPGGERQNPGNMRRIPGGERQDPGNMRRIPGSERQNPGNMRRIPGSERQDPGNTRRIPGSERQNPKLDPRNQRGLSGAGFNVMLRLDRSIHWVAMPFFAVDSCGFPINGAPQNDTLWKGFNAGFSAADCRLENCGSSFGQNPGNPRRVPGGASPASAPP